ncbi:hypothetical protein HEK616_40880 [Streptomyces nigrescens]|uniref:Secreted protein n=1 Tax=Streptomyces nigrescens TaxID=1920 RepID=A0ABM7ZWJ9_STRNI|nr:hypothetical protein [Streptomyces nigrescens]BDM70601.1 hypothetical protein HEK616_40880 [Streptomyces nigrescens]
MSPEVAAAIIGGAAALLTTVVGILLPLVLRRTRGAVEAQGEQTRAVTLDALDAMGIRLQARFNARIDDVRDDIDGVREDVARVREWQAGHDAEHLIIGQPRTGGDPK